MVRTVVLVALIAISVASTVMLLPQNPSSQAGPLALTPQVREDQITIFSDGDGGPIIASPDYVFVDQGTIGHPVLNVAVDQQDYASATFRLEVIWYGFSGDPPPTRCFRLFDKTDSLPVEGSEVCHTSPAPNIEETVRLRSLPFDLADGEHEYGVQYRSTDPLGAAVANVSAARLIAEWTTAASPSPSPSPVGSLLWGDVNCDENVNAVDALALLRHIAGLNVTQLPACPVIGSGYP